MKTKTKSDSFKSQNFLAKLNGVEMTNLYGGAIATTCYREPEFPYDVDCVCSYSVKLNWVGDGDVGRH